MLHARTPVQGSESVGVGVGVGVVYLRSDSVTTKVHTVKAMFFLVVMYGCESRTMN